MKSCGRKNERDGEGRIGREIGERVMEGGRE
jgi:hypothetical protein